MLFESSLTHKVTAVLTTDLKHVGVPLIYVTIKNVLSSAKPEALRAYVIVAVPQMKCVDMAMYGLLAHLFVTYGAVNFPLEGVRPPCDAAWWTEFDFEVRTSHLILECSLDDVSIHTSL